MAASLVSVVPLFNYVVACTVDSQVRLVAHAPMTFHLRHSKVSNTSLKLKSKHFPDQNVRRFVIQYMHTTNVEHCVANWVQVIKSHRIWCTVILMATKQDLVKKCINVIKTMLGERKYMPEA